MTWAGLKSKERILLHLFDYSRFADAYDVPSELTQTGIAKAVDISFRHASQYLRPLVRAALVDERLCHVRGGVRRRKAYTLTALGRREAAALRQAILSKAVPFRRKSGLVEAVPLVRIYQEERRGAALLELLRELHTANCVADPAQVSPPVMVEYTHEAPSVPIIYGREGELDRALRALGRVPILVVTGMPGIGKTAFGVHLCNELRGGRSLFWRRVRPWDSAMNLVLELARFLKASGRTELHAHLVESGTKDLSSVKEPLSADLVGMKALLVFDDVHQASAETEFFFSLLAGVLSSQRGTAALLLSRTVPRLSTRREVVIEERVVEIPLRGLDARSSSALLARSGVDEAEAPRLAKISGGNPLFLKLLAKTAPGGSIGGGLSAVKAYVTEEIDSSLSLEERECLEMASFYQVPIPSEGLLLARLGRTRTLLSLEGKGLLDSAAGGGFLLHDLLRAYFQESLPRARREELADRAVSWLMEEAERLRMGEDLPRAIAFLENASGIDPDRLRKASNLGRLGDLRRTIGDLSGGLEAYREALRESPDREFQAAMHGRVAECLDPLGEFEMARQEVETGLGLLPREPSFAAAVLLATRAAIVFHSSREYDQAMSDIEQALSWLPEPSRGAAVHVNPGDMFPPPPILWARLRYFRGAITGVGPGRGDFSAIEADHRAAIEVLETSGLGVGLLPVYTSLAYVYLDAGKFRDAREILEHKTIPWEKSNLTEKANWLLTKGWFWVACVGNYEEGERLYQESHRLTKKASERMRLLWHCKLFADLYRQQGRIQEAIESLDYFLTASEDLVDPDRRAEALCLMVRLRAHDGDPSGAEPYLRQIEGLVQDGGVSAYHLDWARATVEASLGKTERARVSFTRAMEAPLVVTTRAYVQEDLAVPSHKGEFLLEYGRFLRDAGESEPARDILVRARAELDRHCLFPLGRQAGALCDAMALPRAQT